jgi:hypothetical protein
VAFLTDVRRGVWYMLHPPSVGFVCAHGMDLAVSVDLDVVSLDWDGTVDQDHSMK